MKTGIAPNERWDALDYLRGLSIIGMLLHLSTGDWGHLFKHLSHAQWHGFHLLDMVAPAFLFCVGAAIPISLENSLLAGVSRQTVALRILKRTLTMLAIGLFLNGFPQFDLAHLRIPGVLQRIGLCYFLVGMFVLAVPRPALTGATAVAILLGYAALLHFVPVPGFGAPRYDPVGSWPTYLDRAIFSADHLFIYGVKTDGAVTYDPEGLLSTLPACFNLLAGVLTAYCYRKRLWRQPLIVAGATGITFTVAALVLDAWIPINKPIWTSSFALLSTGFSLLVLALLSAIPEAPARKWLFPAKVFGANALLAFILVSMLAALLDMPVAGTQSIRQLGNSALLPLLGPYQAALAFALICLFIYFLFLRHCYKRRWFLKL